jgi:carbonic anhydrase
MISATEALQRLRDGNRRFVRNEVSKETLASREHRAGAVAPQKPFAIVLACSDSRVPTELIFDCGIGELFVIRVAGNIATPSQIGSIEYAATQIGTPLVVVLGHSNCGAVSATLQTMAGEIAIDSPNLGAIVDAIRPAIEDVAAGDDVLANSIRANVRAAANQLSQKSSILAGLIDDGELQVVAAEYSIETGEIDFIRDN